VQCSGYRNGLRSTASSAKGPGEGAGAHRGLGLAGEAAQVGRRRGPSGGSAWSLRMGSMQGVSGVLIPTGRFSTEMGSQGSNQHGWRNAGSEDLRRWTNSPAAAFGRNSGEARVGGSIAGLEKLPGGEAELLRGLDGVGVQRGSMATTEHELCTAE
jgi:hypothetical protein